MSLSVFQILFTFLLVSGNLCGQAVYRLTTEIKDTALLKKMEQLNPSILSLLSNDNSVLINVRYNDSLVISEYLENELSELSMSGLIAESSNTCIDRKNNLILEQISLKNELYLVKKPIGLEDWEFTGEIAIIKKQEVKKAVLTENRSTLYDRRVFETVVWFSTEQGVRLGPGIYNGFPGLVVRVETQTSTYDLISFKESKAIDTVCPLAGTIVTENQFRNTRRDLLKTKN